MYDGNRNCSWSNVDWTSSKLSDPFSSPLNTPGYYTPPLHITAQLESKMLMPCNAFIRKELHQSLRHLELNKGVVLKSIRVSFLPQVNDSISPSSTARQALVQVVIRVVSAVEVWTLKITLYHISHIISSSYMIS
jgi:hypothetical protein